MLGAWGFWLLLLHNRPTVHMLIGAGEFFDGGLHIAIAVELKLTDP